MTHRRLAHLSALVLLFSLSNDALAQECYASSVVSPSPFMGNNGEIFKLDDGSVWEVQNEYEYLYAYYPSVIICPGRGELLTEGKSLDVQRVAPAPPNGGGSERHGWEVYEETNLEGSISGVVQPGTIFKTASGSIYEVTGLTLQLVLELHPEVLVLRQDQTYKLIVDGFDEPLICSKLN